MIENNERKIKIIEGLKLYLEDILLELDIAVNDNNGDLHKGVIKYFDCINIAKNYLLENEINEFKEQYKSVINKFWAMKNKLR